MILSVKAYIKTRQEVSSDDIKNHFDIDDDTLDAILRPLLKQGHVQKLSGTQCDSGCGTGCASNTAKTLLRWSNKTHPNLLLAVEVH